MFLVFQIIASELVVELIRIITILVVGSERVKGLSLKQIKQSFGKVKVRL